MASGTSVSVGSSTTSAPATEAFSLRAAAGSTTITWPAPTALSAAVVTSPIGPAPNTAAVPPGRQPGQPHRVVADGERLDERADVGGRGRPSGCTQRESTTHFSANPPSWPDSPTKPSLRQML